MNLMLATGIPNIVITSFFMYTKYDNIGFGVIEDILSSFNKCYLFDLYQIVSGPKLRSDSNVAWLFYFIKVI